MKTNQLNSIFENTAVTSFWHHSPPEIHILIIAAVAFLVHVVVKLVRHASEWFILQSSAKKNPFGFVTQQPKFITLTRLIVSGVTFNAAAFRAAVSMRTRTCNFRGRQTRPAWPV